MWHGRGEALEWQDGHREGADEGYTQVRVAKQVPETAKGVVSRDDPAHEDEALVRSLVRPGALPDWDLSPRMTAPASSSPATIATRTVQ